MTKLETLPPRARESQARQRRRSLRKAAAARIRGSLASSRSARIKALIKQDPDHRRRMMIYPLLWMVVSSLRSNDLIFRDPGLLLTSLEWATTPTAGPR